MSSAAKNDVTASRWHLAVSKIVGVYGPYMTDAQKVFLSDIALIAIVIYWF